MLVLGTGTTVVSARVRNLSPVTFPILFEGAFPSVTEKTAGHVEILILSFSC